MNTPAKPTPVLHARKWIPGVAWLLLLGGCAPAGTSTSSTSPVIGSPSQGDGGVAGGAGPSGGSADAGNTSGGDADGGAADGGAQAPDALALDAFITSEMAAARIPGAVGAILVGGSVRWIHGYGLANVAKKVPVTTATLFHLASVSKTVTATAVMQLVEAGRLSLTGKASDAVGFAVANPRFPTVDVTLRMLLTHSSSLIDSSVLDSFVVKDKPSPLTLAAVMTGYFGVGGAYYDAANNFATTSPGAQFAYSNLATSLAGYAVEVQSKTAFDDYCKAHIFAPLGMNESSFRLASLDSSHVARQYDTDGVTDVGNDDYPDFPDGELRTSGEQFARFLLAYMNGGAIDGARILGSDTVAAMLRDQGTPRPDGADAQGIIWRRETVAGLELWNHSGSVQGVSTVMGFDPSRRVGALWFTNSNVFIGGSDAEYAHFRGVFERLLAEGAKLAP